MSDSDLTAASDSDPDLRAEVEKVMAIIRPAIQADEGDIALVEVDEESGVVTVELFGACVTCPGLFDGVLYERGLELHGAGERKLLVHALA